MDRQRRWAGCGRERLNGVAGHPSAEARYALCSNVTCGARPASASNPASRSHRATAAAAAARARLWHKLPRSLPWPAVKGHSGHARRWQAKEWNPTIWHVATIAQRAVVGGCGA